MGQDPAAMAPELTAAVDVPLAQDAAFDLFTRGFSRWWPGEFTWSGEDLLADIGMEPRKDGLLVERGPYGFRADLGRILTWSPPTRLTFLWQIGPTESRCPTRRRRARSASSSGPSAKRRRVWSSRIGRETGTGRRAAGTAIRWHPPGRTRCNASPRRPASPRRAGRASSGTG